MIEAALPAEFSLREIDKELLNKITGKLRPPFRGIMMRDSLKKERAIA